MASYGDIVEMDGQFFEFTPVGYMPVSTGGMLTDPVLDTSFEEPVSEDFGASRLEDTTGIWEEIFTGMGRSDLLDTEDEILQILAETTAAGQPAALPDDDRLTGLSQENLAALLQAILIYNQQLEEQQEVEQQTISEADFNEQFPDIDPSEYTESGTWTDPETGIVYVINIPPEIEEEPTEEEPGGGGEEAPTEEEGEPTEDQPEEEEVIVDPTDSTVDDDDAETTDTIPPDTTEEPETAPAPEPEPSPPVETEEEPDVGAETGIPDFYTVREDGTVVTILDPDTPLEPSQIPPWVDTETPGTYPESGPKPDEEVAEEEPELDLPTEPDIVFDPTRTPDFPGGPAPIPEQEPTEPTEPTTPTEPVPPAEEVPETPTEPTPPAEEPEQPTEETEPTPPTEQPTEQPTPTEEAPETPEQPGTETPSDTPTTGTDDTGTEGEGDAPTTGTGTQPGSGDEGDGTGTGEKRDGLFDDYQEFMTSIGYQPVQLQQLIAPPKKDYFRELDSLIGRSLFGKMI